MPATSDHSAPMVWPLVVYGALVLVVVASMIGLSYFLGQRHRDHDTAQVYESGVAPLGTARIRFSTRFYLVALFFVVFDLEAAFVFAWAAAFLELGWGAYVEMLLFVGILAIALIYLWREGALDWAPRQKVAIRPEQVRSVPRG